MAQSYYEQQWEGASDQQQTELLLAWANQKDDHYFGNAGADAIFVLEKVLEWSAKNPENPNAKIVELDRDVPFQYQEAIKTMDVSKRSDLIGSIESIRDMTKKKRLAGFVQDPLQWADNDGKKIHDGRLNEILEPSNVIAMPDPGHEERPLTAEEERARKEIGQRLAAKREARRVATESAQLKLNEYRELITAKSGLWTSQDNISDYFNTRLKGMLSTACFYNENTFLDLLFEQKEFEVLNGFFSILAKTQKLEELNEEDLAAIITVVNRCFVSLSFPRIIRSSHADVEKTQEQCELFIRVAEYVDFDHEYKEKYFNEIKNRISNSLTSPLEPIIATDDFGKDVKWDQHHYINLFYRQPNLFTEFLGWASNSQIQFYHKLKSKMSVMKKLYVQNKIVLLNRGLFDDEFKVGVFEALHDGLKNAYALCHIEETYNHHPSVGKNDYETIIYKAWDVAQLNRQNQLEFIAYMFEHDPEFAKKLADYKIKQSWWQNFHRQFAGAKAAYLIVHPEHNEFFGHDDESQEQVDDSKIKDHYFRSEQWNVRRDWIVNQLFNAIGAAGQPEIKRVFDGIATHARRFLATTRNTHRAEEGRTKYNELVELFDRLGNVQGDERDTRLRNAQQLIADELSKKTESSDLLKNRGGFFGAYKTYSKILNTVGFHHFSYTDKNGTERTAESTTDHLLMKLYDEIGELLNQPNPSSPTF